VNVFYGAFIPGLREIIAQIVRERLPGVVILKLLDGAILFETQCAYDTLNFFCFNNIFACISVMETVPNARTASTEALEAHIKALVHNTAPQSPDAEFIISHNSKKFRTFRIAASLENKPAALDEKIRLEAEQYIARLSGLDVNRSRPDAEFWFLYRSEGFSIFMKRLTLRPSWEKTLHPGELPPPLAWILCCLGNLKHSDAVLDPFCGYGSIPHAAIKYFHITKFFACDNNEKAAAYTAARFKNRTGLGTGPDGPLVFHKTDFRSLVSLLGEKSIDAIITDPPWGFYQDAAQSIEQLYAEMFSVFDTLLAENGRIVILSARTDELLRAAGSRFTVQKHIPILLSGKKTGIFCFMVTPGMELA
jgi:tRNA G10  N-methylase Trm11